MINITEANEYISLNCIDVEDWTECDEPKKQRILNAASDALKRKYPKYTIPDDAVYEFANTLAIRFNDTNKMALNGIQSFALSGVISVSFKDGANDDISRMIPKKVTQMVGDENGVILGRNVGWSVL